MGRRPTSNDVARVAGVSQTTVSRTFRGDPRVTAPTRDRVLEIARSMGYYPNPIARSMITTRSGIVAVVVPDVVNPHCTTIITALHQALQARGLQMMLFLEENFEQGPHDILRVPSLPADGVVMASATQSSPVVEEILARGLPTVLMQRDVPGLDVDRVMPDDEAGCRAVADHLVKLGHERIAMIAGSPRTSSGAGRRECFEQALRSHRLTMRPDHVEVAEPSFEGSVEAATRLLTVEPSPTAVFCASDTIAITALNVARSMSIDVPADVSIVGFDDIELAGWPTFDLTTVRQDVAEQSQLAVATLLERIDGAAIPPRSLVRPVELVVRGTTAPAAG